MSTISQQVNMCRWEILCRPEMRVGDTFTELGSLVAVRMIESQYSRIHVTVLNYQNQGRHNYCNAQQDQDVS